MSRQNPDHGEFSLIERYFAPLARNAAGAAGLKDDVARVDITPGQLPVVTIDTLVAGIHFFDTDPADDIARKLLRVSLSDLAASGASPVAYFLSLSLPADIDENWIETFSAGLESDQEEFGVLLHGGDTTSTAGPVSLSLTAIGEAEADQIVRRSGAQSGDDVYVSGTIGDASLGLHFINSVGVDKAVADTPGLVARYRLPEPRVELGPRLSFIASAAVDVSDGLLADAGHIAESSACSIKLDFDDIPLSEETASCLKSDESLAAIIVTGGDDYEILFTANPDKMDLIEALSIETGISLTRIGSVAEGAPTVWLRDGNGEVLNFDKPGWQHF